jgi:hypothetical protein
MLSSLFDCVFGIDGGNRFRCAEECSAAAIGFMCVGVAMFVVSTRQAALFV